MKTLQETHTHTHTHTCRHDNLIPSHNNTESTNETESRIMSQDQHPHTYHHGGPPGNLVAGPELGGMVQNPDVGQKAWRHLVPETHTLSTARVSLVKLHQNSSHWNLTKEGKRWLSVIQYPSTKGIF